MIFEEAYLQALVDNLQGGVLTIHVAGGQDSVVKRAHISVRRFEHKKSAKDHMRFMVKALLMNCVHQVPMTLRMNQGFAAMLKNLCGSFVLKFAANRRDNRNGFYSAQK
ncbi:MAG TPA: hypothetical protein VE954_30790 [Oligoflexus sp.]|uniref:hypothetical protein n=1 Tax=Oligoflexus sp. TaxID=1971216 RepID=UPI002D40C2D0|nr:hypothetical protein [Oligoflexus sp.]HYX37512.1 hypothetical protein [Oligoflexus sp.]